MKIVLQKVEAPASCLSSLHCRHTVFIPGETCTDGGANIFPFIHCLKLSAMELAIQYFRQGIILLCYSILHLSG